MKKTIIGTLVYTFSVPTDSRHACPSYLAGYNADYSKSINMMGCTGIEVYDAV